MATNPLYASDLVKDDGEISKIYKQLVDLDQLWIGMMERTKKEAVSLRVQLNKLNETQASHHDQIADTAKQTDELSKRMAKYQDSLGENAIKIAAVKDAQRQLNNVNKLEAKLNASKEGSYNKLSAQYSLLKIRINQLSKEERNNTEEGRKMVEQSRAIYEEMKVLQAETGKTSLNVGNYKDALADIPGPAASVVESTKAIGKGLKALLANPVVLFLTAIVGVLYTLGKAFFRSQDGANLLTKATGLLNAGMGFLTKTAVQVKDGIVEAFNNPREAIEGLGQIIKDQIVNRFLAIPKFAKAALDAVKALWNRDMKALKEAGEDAFFAVNAAITGLDEESTRGIIKAVQETVAEVEKEANAWVNLEEAKISAANANRALTRSIEELTTVEERNQAISDDATRSFEEREKANEAARVALEKRAKLEIQVAKNNAGLINQEIALRRRNKEAATDLLDQQLEAFRAVAAAERSYTVTVLQNEKERRELKQDRLERDLDILLDGYDNQQMINERLLRDERLTFEQRKKIMSETVRLSNDSFARQIETIQQFTGVAIDANEFVMESDAIALNAKIRALGLSEIIEGRLLEIIRDRKTAVRDLTEAEQELTDAEIKYNKQKEEARLKELKDKRDKALEAFDQEQQLAQSSFDLQKTTETQKTAFRIKAERERLQKVLEINEQFAGELTQVQIDTIKNQIARLDQEFADLPKNRSIFDLFGLNLDDGKKESIKNVFSYLKDQIVSFYQFRKEQADKNVEQANKEVEIAQRNLQIELDNQTAGYELRVQLREKELQDARRNQELALREQERAARRERQIQTLQQTTNLITASSKIWKDFGFPLAIPFIGLMFGSFIANKIKAGQLAKQQYGQGGWEDLDFGGSHASGNDIPLGRTKDGKLRTAERGEGLAIFSKKARGRYGSLIPRVVDLFNKGAFEAMFQNRFEGGGVVFNAPSTDMRTTERELIAIRKQNERRTFFNPDGSRVEQYGQNTRVYR